jgi:hypothetical protein
VCGCGEGMKMINEQSDAENSIFITIFEFSFISGNDRVEKLNDINELIMKGSKFHVSENKTHEGITNCIAINNY